MTRVLPGPDMAASGRPRGSQHRDVHWDWTGHSSPDTGHADSRLLFSYQVVSHSFLIPWTVAHQGPQEHMSGLSFPSPGDLPDPAVKSAFPALAGESFTTEPPGKPGSIIMCKLSVTRQAQRGQVVCPRSHSQGGGPPRW